MFWLAFLSFEGIRWPEESGMTIVMAMRKAHETGRDQNFKDRLAEGKVFYKGEYASLGYFSGPVFYVEADHVGGKIKALLICNEWVLYQVEEKGEIVRAIVH